MRLQLLNFNKITDFNGINIKFTDDTNNSNSVYNVVEQPLVETLRSLDSNYGISYVETYQSLIDYDNPVNNPIPQKAFEVAIQDRLQNIGFINVSVKFGEVFNHTIKMNYLINIKGVNNGITI
jgi:hypothetical protein